jgi:hypothetical protein
MDVITIGDVAQNGAPNAQCFIVGMGRDNKYNAHR